MPPIQWEKLLQNRTQCGSCSTVSRIDAPVVVKPETISKRQSQNVSNPPDSQNGIAPNSDISTHDAATTKKPSRA